MRMHCLLAHRRPLSRPSRRPDPRHLLLLLLLFSATSLGLLAYYVSRSSRRVSLFVAPTPNRGTQTTHLPFRPLQSCSEPWVKGIKHRRSTENLEPSQMKSNISGSLFAKHSWHRATLGRMLQLLLDYAYLVEVLDLLVQKGNHCCDYLIINKISTKLILQLGEQVRGNQIWLSRLEEEAD